MILTRICKVILYSTLIAVVSSCGQRATAPFASLKSDDYPSPGTEFKSLLLFFNFTPGGAPASELPGGYAYTTTGDARDMIDEGATPAAIKGSDYIYNYWNRLSSGNVKVRLDTLRQSDGAPLIQTVDMPRNSAGVATPYDWGLIVDTILLDNAAQAWRQAGSFVNPSSGNRLIPSIVAVQRYNVGASTGFSGHTITALDGIKYDIGDVVHIQYDTSWDTTNPAISPGQARAFWRILIHEFGHNFLEFGDLYGPNGATGYYDLLGDYSYAGETSEVSSYFKARKGWTLPQVIEGPSIAGRNLMLAPWTTTGQSFKIVPNPTIDPEEYFYLEYRTSTGPEIWRPDGGMTESGLFVTRINEHALNDSKDGVTNSNKLHDSAFFQPVFSDFSDGGGGTWVTRKASGAVYPYTRPDGSSLASLSDTGNPSLRLVGGLPSGISITNIHLEGGFVKFRLTVDNQERIAWDMHDGDVCTGGRFLPDHATQGGQIFCVRNGAAVLLQQADNKLFVRKTFGRFIGGWNLSPGDKIQSGDLDGDGLDEILIRSPGWLGVLGWNGSVFTAKSVLGGRIGDWSLGGNDSHIINDFVGTGNSQVVFRAPNWLGLFQFNGSGWDQLGPLASSSVDSWPLNGFDVMTSGKITNLEHANLIVANSNAIGVLEWQDANRRFLVRSHQRDSLPGLANNNPAIGNPDAVYAGRFGAGSDIDSLVIRVGQRLMHAFWSAGRLRVSAEADGLIPDAPGSAAGASFDASSAVYSGRFRIDQHALIVQLTDGSLWHVEWMPNTFVAHLVSQNPFGTNWAANDLTQNVLVTDVDRYGPSRDSPVDIAPDKIDDIYVMKKGFVGILGINHLRGADGAPDTLEAYRVWTSSGSFVSATP